MIDDVYVSIYHYCSLETFMNIIKNCTIRLSNITKSNDTLEVKYIIPFIKRAVIELMREYNNTLSDGYKLCLDTIEENLERLFSEFSAVFFVACFSEEKDLLSQWRGYANNANGVSIGFNLSDLKRLQYPGSGYKISQVLYASDEVIKEIQKIARDWIDSYWTVGDDINNINLIENGFNRLLLTMLRYSAFYKNPAFIEEREWRLVYNPFGSIQVKSNMFTYFDRMAENFQKINRSDGFVQLPINFSIDQDRIKSYIDLDFSKFKSTIINEIIIGPKAHINDADLRLFLFSCGFNPRYIRINESRSTYR